MIRRWMWMLPLLVLSGCGYNRIQELDEQVEQSRADIEAELLRRNDLIPNLVATVEEAAEFEQETFTQVAQARAGLVQAREAVAEAVQEDADPDVVQQASATLTGQLRSFINLSVEAYPTLRANESFRALQDELTETENRIAVARRDYNEAVALYNTYIRRFPAAVTARVIGAERREPFEAPLSTQQPPAVEFDR